MPLIKLILHGTFSTDPANGNIITLVNSVEDPPEDYETTSATPVSPTSITPQLITQPEAIPADVIIIIVVVFITALIFLAIVTVLIYICYKARRSRKEKLQTERNDQVQIPSESYEPHVYDHMTEYRVTH